jgi:pilus assembly protein Flp/PilA
MFIAISAHLMTAAFFVRKKLGDAAKGATAVEYGLLVALIAAVIIAVVTTLGTSVAAQFTKISSKLGV